MSALFPLPHVEDSLKRVRVLFAGEYLVDTTNSKLVWTHKWYPYYFFKPEDVKSAHLVESLKSDKQRVFDIVVGNRRAEAAVTEHLEGDLAGLMQISFDAADAWFEEDEQFWQHPKDPYKRVDVLQSSRHVRVELNGVELANTHKPRLLFETSLPVRTYIPKTDVNLDLLKPTDLTTQCPYKGVASYYSAHLPDGTVGENVVWWYRNANLECAQINGFVAFYDEKLDVYVDGVLQKRPGSK